MASFSGGYEHFTSGPLPVVCAWGSGSPGYHGGNRVAGTLDFASTHGDAFHAEDPDEHLRAELRLHMGFHVRERGGCGGGQLQQSAL